MKSACVVSGGCHCGAVHVDATLTRPAEGYEPRACDCDFCRLHGGAYVSDSNGMLRIRVAGANRLQRYQQGSGQADMLICARCGVLIGASYQHGEQLFAVVNARVLAATFGADIVTSPQQLGANDKVSRWLRLWFSDVVIEQAAA